MVDEAHGLGVLGDQGKGVTSYYNLEKRSTFMSAPSFLHFKGGFGIVSHQIFYG